MTSSVVSNIFVTTLYYLFARFCLAHRDQIVKFSVQDLKYDAESYKKVKYTLKVVKYTLQKNLYNVKLGMQKRKIRVSIRIITHISCLFSIQCY